MEDIIIKWKLNKALLASKMGMPLTTFSQKVNRKHNSFTPTEKERLKGVLIELRNDLEPIDDIDFNEALSKIVGSHPDTSLSITSDHINNQPDKKTL